MKKVVVAALLISMVAMYGCAKNEPFPEWTDIYTNNSTTVSDSESLSQYNLEEEGLVRIGEQSDIASMIWAKTATAAMESNLIIQGLATVENINLSEAHTIYYAHEYVEEPEENVDCVYITGSESQKIPLIFQGAYNDWNGIGLLTKGVGPIDESLAPFSLKASELGDSLANLVADDMSGTMEEYSGEWLLKELNSYDVSDKDLIKQVLMEKGALYLPMALQMNNINEGKSYYSSYKATSQNYAVSLIGWDDNYSKENFFGKKPENNGAWLAYDSCAKYYGGDGYLYISYEDKGIIEALSFEMCSRNDYGEILSYDRILYGDTIKLTESNYTSVANLYSTEEDEELKAVGLYTIDPGQTVEINVYTNVIDELPESGILASNIVVTPEYSGYHAIDLTETVPIKAGEKFSVVLKYFNDENHGTVPVEASIKGMSGFGISLKYQLTSEEGQSYVFDGNEWLDMSKDETASVFEKETPLNNAYINALLKQ